MIASFQFSGICEVDRCRSKRAVTVWATSKASVLRTLGLRESGPQPICESSQFKAQPASLFGNDGRVGIAVTE